MEVLEKKFEQEGKTLRLRVSELERKLEVVTQDLAVAESTLAVRATDLASLQNNLKELEELREMKEVIILYWIFIFVLTVHYIFRLVIFLFLNTHKLRTFLTNKFLACFQDIDRKNEQTAAILKMQAAQLAELEVLYKDEQVLRKRYFNIIDGWHCLKVFNIFNDILLGHISSILLLNILFFGLSHL